MLTTIFAFETKRWFKSWSFYVFLLLFGGLGFLLMGSAMGYFDAVSVTTASNTYVNTPIAITGMLNAMSMFINFIIPTIIGATIYRDFKSNVHTILYSYPFTKRDYLLGKFLSGLFVTTIVSLSVALGMIVATLLPLGNHELLTSFNLWSYLQAFVYFIVPNVFIVGSVTFMLVTFTRNEYVGYIFALLLLIGNSILLSSTSNVDDMYAYTFYDYSGLSALGHVTEYWTINEQNVKNIPFDGLILYNRLLWMGVGLIVFAITYVLFKFDFNPLTLKKKKNGSRVVKNNFNTDSKVELSTVSFDYSFFKQIKTAFALSSIEFKSIRKNWLFIIFILVILISMGVQGYQLGSELYGSKKYPVTGSMLNILRGNSTYIGLLVFLFSGVLLNQGNNSRMHYLVDATPVRNWTLLLSKVIALLKMNIALMLLGMLGCILIQAAYGFYDFQIGVYLQYIFQFALISSLITIIYSLFIQSFFNKFYIGFFAILVFNFIPMGLEKLGIEMDIFHFNSGPSLGQYSIFDGFGQVREYFFYKLYWLFFCGILYGLTLLLWKRGIVTAKERIQKVRQRLQPAVWIPMLVCAIGFLFLGYKLYERQAITEPFYTSQQMEKMQVEYEKKYKKYEHAAQPRITDVNVDLELYPKERNFKATGNFVMVNKSDRAIDTLFVSYDKTLKEMNFDREFKMVYNDTIMDFRMYRLSQSLKPGDSLKVKIVTENETNTWLNDRSFVQENGTFVNNMQLFPSFGYSSNYEIIDNDVRAKYDLPKKDRMLEPNDPEGRKNTYISHEADWINFETTVSTSEDQIAIAPGYLQKEWNENGRRYFHYKMDSKILNFYAYNSATYEVKRETENGINYEVYYIKGHEYNVDRMMESMKRSIQYYSENFAPYPHKQARIIEFPLTMGTFAQAFANTMPFSEGIGFVAKIDDENPDAVDYPFSVVSHEMAHQWWAHQLIGADVKGATMMSESLSEYSSLKVLEHKYGRGQMHKFLKDALDNYLLGRTYESIGENPLMYNENQQYIHYNKGSLVFYALSEYIGEKNLNNILKSFLAEHAFQDAPYVTSLEFVAHLKKNVPAEYQYLIKDMFEDITLYDNKVIKSEVKSLPSGEYQVDVYFQVAKYKTDKEGVETYKDASGKTLSEKVGKDVVKSLPLNDYVFVGIYGEKTKNGNYSYENELLYKKVKVNKIQNKVSFVVKEKPVEVGVDPYNILIDRDSNDNRKSVN